MVHLLFLCIQSLGMCSVALRHTAVIQLISLFGAFGLSLKFKLSEFQFVNKIQNAAKCSKIMSTFSRPACEKLKSSTMLLWKKLSFRALLLRFDESPPSNGHKLKDILNQEFKNSRIFASSMAPKYRRILMRSLSLPVN